MEPVGQILKINRERKNLILSDVSKELKISEEILYNIENGYLQNDIDIVFILGHLRAYCSFLNLNENEIVSKFKNENLPTQNKNLEIKRPIVEIFESMDTDGNGYLDFDDFKNSLNSTEILY